MSTSTAQSPQFTYPGPGSYTVTLQVANAGGSSQTQKVVQVQPLGGFTFVRQTGAGGTAGATSTVMTPPSITAGNLLVVSVFSDGSNDCTGVTDSLGNTYNSLMASMTYATRRYRAFYTFAAVGGTSPTVTATWTVGIAGYGSFYLSEYQPSGAPVFIASTQATGTGSAGSAGSQDLSGRTNLLVIGVGHHSVTGASQPSGWVARGTSQTYVDQILPPPGVINYAPTFPATGTWVAQMLAFSATLAVGAPPAVTITAPTAATTFATEANPLTISGTASDDVGVGSITWTNNRGGSGTATGTTAWSFAAPLQPGANVLTVTAHDTDGNVSTDALTVTYTVPAQNRRTLYTDDFLRPDAVDLGLTWEPYLTLPGLGRLNIVNQRLRPGALSPTIAYETHTGVLPLDAWCSIRLVTLASRADRDNCVLVLRAASPPGPNTNYRLEVYRASGEAPTLLISKMVNGAYTAKTGEITIPTPIWQEGAVISFSARGGADGTPVVLTGYVNDVQRITAQDTAAQSPIITAGRAGLFAENITDGNLQLTNFASGDFTHALTMTAGRGDFTLSGKTVTLAKTASVGIRMVVAPGAFTLTGQDVGMTAPSPTMTVGVGAFTLSGQVVATFKTATTTPNIFPIRVLRFIPGRVALLVLRATVPGGEEARYTSASAVSLHPFATPEELAAIRAGQIMERRVSLPASQILTFAALKTAAEAAQTAFQAELSGGSTAGMAGVEGVLTKFSGVDWS